MIVGKRIVYNPPPSGFRTSTYPLAYCDQCESKIDRSSKVRLLALWKQKFHYCSKECFRLANRKGGRSRIALEEKLQQKFGVSNVMQISKVKKKYEATVEERFGSPSMMGTKHFKSERKKTWLDKYGVDHNFKIPEIQEKSREARLSAAKSFPSSKSEDRFYSFLCSIFGESDVERQVRVHIWPIDFYIKSIDVFIQFDGVYWHGLDRPLSEIKKFRTQTDRIIYKKWLTDHHQNDYFYKQKMRLFRFTDTQFSLNLPLLKQVLYELKS